MFFNEAYTEENAAILSKRVEDYGQLEICYETSPVRPVLATIISINSDPFTFKNKISQWSLYTNCKRYDLRYIYYDKN
jgi:hypothetical protein